jgi:hypothetical protein
MQQTYIICTFCVYKNFISKGLYYLNKGVLPESLATCDINPDTFVGQKTDRMTREPYLYRVIDATHFEVGAHFDLPTPTDGLKAPIESSPGLPMQDAGFWVHGSGRETFVIDVTGEKRP